MTGRWTVLATHVRPHRRWLAAAAATGLAATAMAVAMPLVTQRLVETLMRHRPVAGVVVLLTVLAGGSAALSAAKAYLVERVAASVVLDVRRTLVSHLIRLRLAVLDRGDPGDLTARVTSDSALLSDVITVTLIGGGTAAVTLICVVVLMSVVDPVLLAVTLATLASAGVLIALLMRRIHRAATAAQEATGATTAALERVFGALRTVKANGAEAREEAGTRAVLTRLWRASVRSEGWAGVASGLVELTVQAAFLVVLAAGAARVATGATGIGSLVAFLLYVFMLVGPASQLVQGFVRYQVAAAGADRVNEALALPAEPPADPENAGPAGGEAATVAFDDVRFAYGPESATVHAGVTFEAAAPGLTAVIGASGTGKTTLFSLVERFYEVGGGAIRVDGRDVREWPLGGLRAAVGYVDQDASALSGTVRDNLTFGAPDAGDERLWSVLRRVRLDAVVAALPDGLDTQVGHRAARFSGGERQRLAIARAVLRGPRLLLLDEVTSQLDPVNEAALRDTVAEIARTTTVLVIAHRLSTVVSADRIVVLDAGRVRTTGTHAELVRDDAEYAGLAATQLVPLS